MNLSNVNVKLLGRFLCRLRRTASIGTVMGSKVEGHQGSPPGSDPPVVLTTSKPDVIHRLQLIPRLMKDYAMTGAKLMDFGGVIAIPTDTVYGLAADLGGSLGIMRLYDIKARDPNKPIAICVGVIDEVYGYGKVTISRDLLEELLPGPVTLVFERTDHVNPALNPGNNLIGIRLPDSEFVRQLVAENDGPFALTSANPSSTPSCLHPDEFHSLWPELALIIDGGRLGSNPESPTDRDGSTVIDLSKEGYFKIIRRGAAYEKSINILTKHNLKEIVA